MPKTPAGADLIWDGFGTVSGGMNNGIAAELLTPNQATLLINATVRGNFVRQRPGFRRVMSVLQHPPGFFQHFGAFRTDAGQQLLVAVCGGRFFRIEPRLKTVQEFTIDGDPNPSTLERGWSVQGEQFWIYNDGQTKPLIWTGGSARRAGLGEIQPGTVIAYVQGRLWYALPDGISFRAGDLVRNPDSGSAAYQYRDSILHETENTYLNEGGDFAIPGECGEITAMFAVLQLDLSQGQGPLQVLCTRNGFSVNTPVDRTIWKNVQYPIQTESLIGAGCTSQQSVALVNGDAWFRGTDGWRSWMIARRQFRDFGNTPQSFEMSGFFDFDQTDLLAFASSGVWDNRVFMTLCPQWSEAGVYHKGLGVVNLAPITAMLGTTPPVFDGLWTGLNILAVRQTVDALYVLVLEDDGGIALWALTKDELFDDEDGRIEWSVATRALFVEKDDAGRVARQLKRLETGDFEYDQLVGEVNFDVSWSPDGYPCPTDWVSWKECVPGCFATFDCSKPLAFQSGYQARKRLPAPPDTCTDGARKPLRNFYHLNPRIDVTGPARLLSIRFGATEQSEPKYDANACEVVPCLPIQCCGSDPFRYRSQGSEGGGSGSGSGSGSGGSGGPPEPPPPPGPFPATPIDGLAPGGPSGEPPPPPLEIPDGPLGIPVVNGWQAAMQGLYDSNFAITKVTDSPQVDGIDESRLRFWQESLISAWNEDPFRPTGWTQTVFAWTFVDPYSGYYGDFQAKYATGNPHSEVGDPIYQPGPMWILTILYR